MAKETKITPTFDLAHELSYRSIDLAVIGGRIRERISTPRCGILLTKFLVDDIRQALAKMQAALDRAIEANEANN